MGNESRITGDYCMEIWEEPDCKIGRKPIDRFVSILDRDAHSPRAQDMVSYPLSDLMVVTFFAMLGGAESFEDVEVMCTSKQKYLRTFLPLKEGTPSCEILFRAFSLLDMESFGEAQVASIMKHLIRLRKRLGIPEPVTSEQEEEAKASSQESDGAGKLRRFLQNLHVSPSNNGISLRSSKKNTSTALIVQNMLSTMDLRKTMVSFDVMSAQGIGAITEGKGHYIGRVKEGQKALLEKSAGLFTPDYLKRKELDPNLFYKTMEQSHGLVEECTYTVATVKDKLDFSEWPGVRTVMRVEKKTENLDTGQKTEETRYYITSMEHNAQACAKALSEGWQEGNFRGYCIEAMIYDGQDMTVNKRADRNLLLMTKMVTALYKMMKPHAAPCSSIKKGFYWGYEDMLARMLHGFDNKTLKEVLEGSLEKSDTVPLIL